MRLRVLSIAALTAVLLSACEKDFSEENGDFPGGTQLASATNAIPGFVNNSGCKDCEYVPMCSGSVYKYKDTDAGGIVNNITYTMKYLKDTTMEGRNYKKFEMGNLGVSYLNCVSGVSSMISASGAAGALLKQTLIKANEALGATWTDPAGSTGSVTSYYSVIAEKNISKTVAGVTYTEVIHITRYPLTMSSAGVPVRSTYEEYFYARGKGLIERKSFNDAGALIGHRELISAVIAN